MDGVGSAAFMMAGGDPFDSNDDNNEHAYGNNDADNDLSTVVFTEGVSVVHV